MKPWGSTLPVARFPPASTVSLESRIGNCGTTFMNVRVKTVSHLCRTRYGQVSSSINSFKTTA